MFLFQAARQKESLHEFARDVLGVRRAAAVAAYEQLAAIPVAFDDHLDGRLQRLFHGGERRVALDQMVDGGQCLFFCHNVPHFYSFFFLRRFQPMRARKMAATSRAILQAALKRLSPALSCASILSSLSPFVAS